MPGTVSVEPLKGEKLCRDFKILRYGNIYSSDSLEAGLLGSEFNLTVIGGNCWTKLSDWLIKAPKIPFEINGVIQTYLCRKVT